MGCDHAHGLVFPRDLESEDSTALHQLSHEVCGALALEEVYLPQLGSTLDPNRLGNMPFGLVLKGNQKEATHPGGSLILRQIYISCPC